MTGIDSCSPTEIAFRREGEFRRGIVAALPVMAGFVPFALVLGAQALGKGFSPLEVPLMTGLNFGGGGDAPCPGTAVLPQSGGHRTPPWLGSGILDPICCD